MTDVRSTTPGPTRPESTIPGRRLILGDAGRLWASRAGRGTAPGRAAERGDVDQIAASACDALGKGRFAAGFERGGPKPDEARSIIDRAPVTPCTPVRGDAHQIQKASPQRPQSSNLSVPSHTRILKSSKPLLPLNPPNRSMSL